jgi:hypothetical protein
MLLRLRHVTRSSYFDSAAMLYTGIISASIDTILSPPISELLCDAILKLVIHSFFLNSLTNCSTVANRSRRILVALMNRYYAVQDQVSAMAFYHSLKGFQHAVCVCEVTKTRSSHFVHYITSEMAQKPALSSSLGTCLEAFFHIEDLGIVDSLRCPSSGRGRYLLVSLSRLFCSKTDSTIITQSAM